MMKRRAILSKSCARPSPQRKCTRRWISAALVLGRPRHLSIHPGGVVISPGSMHELTATQMTPKGLRITQLDLRSIEYLGLVKIDLLGIRGLSVLGDVENALRAQAQQGITVLQPEKPAPGSPPPVDEEVSDMLQQGRTIGCFQIESPGIRGTCARSTPVVSTTSWLRWRCTAPVRSPAG